MNVPGLDAYYGDPPDDEDGPCDMCAFTDTHCGECEDCCLPEEIVRLRAEVKQLREPLDPFVTISEAVAHLARQILELDSKIGHLRERIEDARGEHAHDKDTDMCVMCMRQWPCPTVQALDGDA